MVFIHHTASLSEVINIIQDCGKSSINRRKATECRNPALKGVEQRPSSSTVEKYPQREPHD
jgi:hypothetical protein